jgi:hypothetical protein
MKKSYVGLVIIFFILLTFAGYLWMNNEIRKVAFTLGGIPGFAYYRSDISSDAFVLGSISILIPITIENHGALMLRITGGDLNVYLANIYLGIAHLNGTPIQLSPYAQAYTSTTVNFLTSNLPLDEQQTIHNFLNGGNSTLMIDGNVTLTFYFYETKISFPSQEYPIKL